MGWDGSARNGETLNISINLFVREGLFRNQGKILYSYFLYARERERELQRERERERERKRIR